MRELGGGGALWDESERSASGLSARRRREASTSAPLSRYRSTNSFIIKVLLFMYREWP